MASKSGNALKRPKKKKKNRQTIQPWREIVRDHMYEAALIETQVKSNSNDPVFLYRWEHVCAVVNVALRLAELTGADVDIIEAAAWLHDVAKDAGSKHPQKGAKYARNLLPRTDFPEGKIEDVCQVIEDHMGLWRDEPLEKLESQVLWDADKLTKIGLTAAMHWVAGGLAVRNTVTTESIIKRLNSNEWRTKTVASMHTEPARRAAQQRFDAYEAFRTGLRREWRGDDLLP